MHKGLAMRPQQCFRQGGGQTGLQDPKRQRSRRYGKMQRLPNTSKTQAIRDEIQAYLTAAMAQTVENVNQAQAPSISVESSHSR